MTQKLLRLCTKNSGQIQTYSVIRGILYLQTKFNEITKMLHLTHSMAWTDLSYEANNYLYSIETPFLQNSMVHFYHECPLFDLTLSQFYSFHTFIICNANFKIIYKYTEISSHKSIKQKFC